MSSTQPNIKKTTSIDQMSWTHIVKTKTGKHSKKIMIHQSGSPLPPDDFVLFPQEVVKEKHSSVRNTKPRKPTEQKCADRSSPLKPRHHVIDPKAPALSQGDTSRPSERQTCLKHMSTVNCTVDCVNANAKPLARLKVPPKAPSPPRLPTPDVSDLEEDDLWSCCGSPWSSLSRENSHCDRKADPMWNEMEGKLMKAKAWQSRSSTDSRRVVLKRDR